MRKNGSGRLTVQFGGEAVSVEGGPWVALYRSVDPRSPERTLFQTAGDGTPDQVVQLAAALGVQMRRAGLWDDFVAATERMAAAAF